MDLEGVEVLSRDSWGRSILRGYSPNRRKFVEIHEIDCFSREQGEIYLSEMMKIRNLADNRVLGEIIDMEYHAERRVIRVIVPCPTLTLAQFLNLRQKLAEEQIASLLLHLLTGLHLCFKSVKST